MGKCDALSRPPEISEPIFLIMLLGKVIISLSSQIFANQGLSGGFNRRNIRFDDFY